MNRLFILLTILMISWVHGQEVEDAPPAGADEAQTAEQAERERMLAGKAGVFRRDLAYRLEDGLTGGMDVSEPLKLYMKARAMGQNTPMERLKLYYTAMRVLKNAKLKPLPKTKWPALPKNVDLKLRTSFKVQESVWNAMTIPYDAKASFRVVEYKVDGLKQYAIMTEHKEKDRPLIIFSHGAAFGVPDYMLPWMARIASYGYVVAAPSLRGEPLLVRSMADYPTVPDHLSEGSIENLKGEPNDILGLAIGLREKGLCAKGKYGIVGHSFGAGAALMATVRTKDIAFMVSYDAWLTNPFRFYWERLANEGSMNDKAYLWGSWEAFAKQPAKQQLTELMTRSIVHHAAQVNSPLLLFIGGSYNGSAYHYSHKELVKELKAHKKPFRYEIMPDGGHNFVLYSGVEPAVSAFKLQMAYTLKHLPPKGKKKE
jgi:dienelactone hydrolase